MVHYGERLTLRLEPADHLLGVHAGLDDFESDPALHRLGLLGQVDDADTAFTERLEDLVVAYAIRCLAAGRVGHLGWAVVGLRHASAPQEDWAAVGTEVAGVLIAAPILVMRSEESTTGGLAICWSQGCEPARILKQKRAVYRTAG